MFQGSRHVAEDTFFLNLERVGGTGINGTTGDDRTNYFETVPAGRLGLALWLESDRMAFLLDHVDQATFESQRSVVLNERRQSYENAPYGNVSRFLHEALYPAAHPYHRLAIGTPEDLHAASLEDVRNFFRTWYVPNNATLVLAGDFQPAHARELVEQYFGPIPRGADVPRQPAPAAVQLAGQTTLHVDAGVQLPRVYIAWPTPAFYAAGDGELDLVANVLSTGRSSRLYRRMVYDQQIAQDVNAGQASSQLGSMFMVTATARPGHTPEELLGVIDEELTRLRGAAPDAGELLRARTDIETSMVFDIERVAERADRFNRYNQLAGDPDYFARDLARYQRATAESVQAAARAYLPAERRVVIMVHPAANAPVSGQLRGAPAPNAPTASGGHS
jgi:predicted Zn-dependent peptidase